DVHTDRINIIGALDSGSRIGIRTKTADPIVVFTDGFTGRATINNFFRNDVAEITIREIGGELAACLLRVVTLSGSDYTATDPDGVEHSSDFIVAAGDTITLTTPENKKLNLSSLKCGDDDVEATQVSYRSYTFVMPGGDVFVTASASNVTIAHVPAVTESCTEDGNIEHWTVTVPGSFFIYSKNYYTDERCRDVDQIDAANIVVAALGHNYVNNVCTNCGKTLGAIDSWADLQTFFNNAAENYNEAYLINDITAGTGDTVLTVPAGKAVTLDLKGFVIDRNMSAAAADGAVLNVEAGASLTINDSSERQNGKIQGGKGSGASCGGVSVNGTFIMNGGNITGNTAGYTGGVYVGSAATFTMNGGSIQDNTGSDNSSVGGVLVNGTFTMNGGSIDNNEGKGCCGVCVYYGTFIMNDGAIADNTINNSISSFGGVDVQSGIFTMNGGSITGNTGGVDVDSNATFNVSGEVMIINNNNIFSNSLDVRAAVINIVGALPDNARIGVYKNSAGAFTNGLSGKGEAYNFISNVGTYRVRINGSNEAELYEPSSSPTLTFKLATDSNGGYSASVNGTVYSCTGSDVNVTAKEGETICLSCASDYRFVSFTGVEIEEIDYKGAVFVMPAENVEVTVGVNAFEITGHYPAKDPTCTMLGNVKYWTGRCNDSETVEYYINEKCRIEDKVADWYGTSILALDHDWVQHDAKAVTCTENGWDAYQACPRCGWMTSHNEYAATGHTYVIDAAVAPTCTTTGLTQGKHCSVCNEVFVAQEEIPALGHDYVGSVCTRCDKNKYDVTSWAELQALFDEDDNFSARLINDITAGTGDTTLTVPKFKTVTLDLNGFTIDRNLSSATSYSNDGGVISIGSLVGLTINDSSADHTGKITGGHGSGNNAAVCVGANATFTLNGGSITGNVGRYQGGVYVNGGTFIMNGGSITGNTGGLCGGVEVFESSFFTMNDGLITGNTGDYSGGVYLEAGRFTMNGGSITDNTGSYCGGVYVSSNSSFTMKGGMITGNTSSSSGAGGVSASGTFTMNGGSITGNTGTYGGVSVWGTMKISGDVNITGNTGGNVVIDNGSLTISDYLVSTSSIGLSHATSTPTVDTPVKVVNGFTGSNASLKSFFSDNDAYVVRKNSSGNYLELRVGHVVVLEGTGYVVADEAGEHTESFSAAAGETITLIAVIDKRISGLTVTPESGSVTVDTEDYRTRTFAMPDCDVTVSATVEDFVVTHVSARAATCTEEGATEHWEGVDENSVTHYYTDEECLTEVERSEVYIDALGHDLVHHDGQAATCTEVGWEAYDTCSRCDYTTYEEIPALGHNYENGFCTRCDKNKYTVTTWAELQALFDEDDDFSARLLNNITAADGETTLTVPENKTIILELNGFTIDRGLASAQAVEDGTVIRVKTGATLTINDSSEGHTGSITGGYVVGDGGGIYVEESASLTLNNVTVTGNQTYYVNSSVRGNGAGIYTEQNVCLTLNNVTVANNRTRQQKEAYGGGLHVCKGSTLTMDGCTITGNYAGYVGGIMIEGCTVSIKNSTISNNVTYYRDVTVGILIMSDDVNYLPQGVLENCVVSDNQGSSTDTDWDNVGAGGVTVRSCGGEISFLNCTISGNTSLRFGGVMIDRYRGGYPTVTISGGRIYNNNITTSESNELCSGVCVYGASCTLTGGVQIYDNGRNINNSKDAGVIAYALNGYLHLINGTISNNASRGIALYPEKGRTYSVPTFVMDGGEISDNPEGVHVRVGTFTMNGGTISSADSNNESQGVMMEATSKFNFSSGNNAFPTFVMNGGTISDYKYGVYDQAGTFTMNGGTISNTGSIENASGVYANGGTFNLSGNVTITNTTGPGILLTAETPTIGIVGALAETTSVSVSIDPEPEASTPTKVFTSGASGKVIMNNFTSYNEAYAVRLIGGEAAMCLLSDVTLDGTGYTAVDAVGEHAGTFSAAAGDTIYITVPANKKITGANVTTDLGAVSVDTTSYRTMAFIMPGCGVTVSSVTYIDFVVTHVPAAAATCTEEGATEHWEGVDENSDIHYYTDEECLTEVERSEVYTAALGHELIHHDAQAATCTEKGWNAYDTCSRCDYTTYAEIPALDHDLIRHDAQAATCTEKGWNAY
ncbi:MAG: hypothetical protein J5781_05480, partial [Clostridia bacterium]|nr:hypothetical protein [Clostridia bacterium]